MLRHSLCNRYTRGRDHLDQFHDGDLIQASLSVPVMKWNLPAIVHNAMAAPECENHPMLAEDERRLMGRCRPDAEWIFMEVHGGRLHSGKPTPITQDQTDRPRRGV
jgi:hypothetical protein